MSPREALEQVARSGGRDSTLAFRVKAWGARRPIDRNAGSAPREVPAFGVPPTWVFNRGRVSRPAGRPVVGPGRPA